MIITSIIVFEKITKKISINLYSYQNFRIKIIVFYIKITSKIDNILEKNILAVR